MFFNSIPYSPWSWVALSLTTYVSVCHLLRYRSLNHSKRKYGYGTKSKPSYEGMTDQEAHEILTQIAEMEFPALFEKGLQLALFRTYGIPTISKLLVKTNQLTSTEQVGKRYADTTVLVTEIYENPPSGERAYEAIARLNYLHGHYRKQGKVTNDDMLYTLALFMNHPVEWINRYEWRQLTDLEVCGIATFHKSMGDAMEISYDVLPGSKTGWKDGLQFYRELDGWAKDYEARVMVPSQDNYDTAIKTKELLLETVPSFTHGFVADMMSAAMDDRLRSAIMFDKPRDSTVTFFNRFMAVRRWYLRHLALPRFEFQRSNLLSKKSDPDGRRWIEFWSTTPVYVKPTFWNRWGPPGWYQLMIGGPRPGDPGMRPEGYLRANVGPKAFEGKGKQEFLSTKEKLSKTRLGGCPFVALK